MAKNKKSDKPKHVSIYYEHILYDLEFMSDEQAGKLLKMLVWYSMGDKRSLEQLEKTKKAIGVLPPHERGWITSVCQRLFNCIDADLEQYKEKCEKQRQRIQNYWDERKRETTERETNAYHGIPRNTTEYHGIPRNTTEYHGIPRNTTEYHGIPRNTTEYHGIPRNTTEEVTLKGKGNKKSDSTEYHGIPRNTTEYHGIPWNTILDNDNDNDPITINILEEEEEEEEEEAREEKKSEALSLDSFCELWNGAIARAKRKRDVVAMKPIAVEDLPNNAQERIVEAVRSIIGWLDDQTIARVRKTCRLPSKEMSREDLAKWYMLAAIEKYSQANMKSRDSSFGTFNWFINYPVRIRKLFDGDIQ